MAGVTIECDVCSQIIPQTKVPSHILLHMSQIFRLCRSLPHIATESNEDLQSYDDGICGTTDQESWTDRGDHTLTAPRKTCKCPACEHAPFSRRQELVRHFARHYKIEKTCDDCSNKFSIASKYIWHRCGPDAANHQESYKKRWQSLRKDVERALDEASGVVGPRKRRQEPRIEPRKKRKTAHSGERSTNAATINTPLILREEPRPPVEREASPSNAALQLISSTPLLQAEDSVQPNGPSATDANFPQSCHVTDYSSTWCISSSDAPIIWDDWNWPGGDSWVPGNQN